MGTSKRGRGALGPHKRCVLTRLPGSQAPGPLWNPLAIIAATHWTPVSLLHRPVLLVAITDRLKHIFCTRQQSAEITWSSDLHFLLLFFGGVLSFVATGTFRYATLSGSAHTTPSSWSLLAFLFFLCDYYLVRSRTPSWKQRMRV